jgi:hypothetical protein
MVEGVCIHLPEKDCIKEIFFSNFFSYIDYIMPRTRPPIKSILDFGKKVVPILCPKPSISLALPPKITFSCH